MAKNTWFKHYNESHEGHLLGNLIAAKQYEAALLWWVLLELVSRFEDENNRGTCTIPLARIARAMNMTQPRVEALLGQLTSNSPSSHTCNISASQPRLVSISIAKWLELQENRGGKNSAKKEQKAPRSKKEEVRSKELDVVDVEEAENSQQQQQNFSEISPEEFFENKNGAASTTLTAPNAAKESDSKAGVTTSNPKRTFQIIDELRGKSIMLDEILIFISPTTQKSWASRFDLDWLIKVLTNAAEYYMNQRNAQTPSEIDDWGKLLVMWLRREKKPILGGSTEITAATIAQWDAEILENQKKGVL